MSDKAPRKTKTAAQRAAEALEVAQRKVEKLAARVEHLETELATTRRDLEAYTARRDYLADDPDLTDQDRTRILGDDKAEEIPVDDAELNEPAETGRHTTTERTNDNV